MNEEVERVTQSELLDSIRSERGLLEATLSEVDVEQMEQPGVEGDWSVKDVVAHIVAWEQRMVGWVAAALRGEVPEVPRTWDDVHRVNEQIYRENRDRALCDVLADLPRSYQEALRAAEDVSEDDLVDPDRFGWRAGEPLWKMVAANTSWHYREHCQSLRAWLDQPGRGAGAAES